ncbi:TonB-dependent receptor [Sphingopyxis yananensis]|uniref:TonB-dependent receptor n=1 Tax=Sphingopyxis yananensis TaxID=2886687 RepID=UPI001D0F6EE2|nr:TonB-dependent receptor [Sphingopyxis yananensis]MCC2601243.1 TonB-dependent receptor [Sphingopyxis yananensis]
MTLKLHYLGRAALVFPTLFLAVPALAMNMASDAASDAGAEDSGHAPIQVIGHRDPVGLLPAQDAPRSISAISSEFITKQAPTMNAFQLVNILPGANVAMSDPYGLSASSGITLRGLGQDSIGVLMEGAPQNDIGYFYAYPAQFADTENIKQIILAQGSVDIDSPVVAAAGGMISLSLDDPKDQMGALVNLSYGSYDARRAFVRVDTGEIGNSGVRAFLSYSNNRADNWRGAGFDKRQHVDAKFLTTWGDSNRASISFSYNDAKTSTYPAVTKADWKAVGRDYNFDADYGDGNLNYWRLYRAPFRNLYISAPLQVALNDRLTLNNSAYLQMGHGNSPYGTELWTEGNYLGTELLDEPINLPGAVDGKANVMGNWTGKQFRVGDVAKLTLQAGAHRVTAGLWFDYGTDRVTQSYTSLNADGRPVDEWGYQDKAIRTADGRLLAYENARTVTVTKGAFLADSIALSDKLGVDVGLKAVNVLRRGHNYLPGPQSDIRYSSSALLPRAAIRYDVGDSQQIFANVNTNFRIPNEFALYDYYYDGVVVSQGSTSLKNEYSVSSELGYRYNGAKLSLALTAFHYWFRNRQVPTILNDGGAQVSATVNAGSMRSHGLDAEISYRPTEGWGIYLSGEILRTKLLDDLPVGYDFLPTKGKNAVASPKYQFAAGSSYDDGLLFGSMALKYVGRQYATFMNDESIKPYATLDLSIGVHLAGMLDGKRTDLRLNAINITNPKVLSGVYSVSSNALDTEGRGGTNIYGSAPSYYIGSGRAFVGTLSRAF